MIVSILSNRYVKLLAFSELVDVAVNMNSSISYEIVPFTFIKRLSINIDCLQRALLEVNGRMVRCV